MDIVETMELMLSSDYKDRFKAEFYQLDIRIKNLQTLLKIWEAGDLDFVPMCDKNMLYRQLSIMTDYRDVLLKRAKLEGIELKEV